MDKTLRADPSLKEPYKMFSSGLVMPIDSSILRALFLKCFSHIPFIISTLLGSFFFIWSV